MKTKEMKGITLVALVVTIVVLLILAGVSINAVLGDNGIIKQSKLATEETSEKVAREEIKRIVTEYELTSRSQTLEEFLKTKIPDRIDSVINNGDGTLTVTKNGYAVTVNNTEKNSSNGPGSGGSTGGETQTPEITIGEAKVVANSDGTGSAITDAASVYLGDTLYITFSHSITGGTTTVDKTIPYAVTKNGTYKFTVTGTVNGTAYTKEVSVTVNQFREFSIDDIQIGDSVNYTYDSAGSYSLSSTYSGYSSNQTIAKTTGLTWKVLNVDKENDTVDIISTNPTSSTVYFSNILGYNNGPYLMNEICKAQYSNKTLGVEARSINLLDMEKHLTPTGIKSRNEYNKGSSTDAQYRTTKTYTSSTKYPSLYANQKGAGPNLTAANASRISQPDITRGNDPYEESKAIVPKGTTEPTTSSTYGTGSPLTVTQTYYHIPINDINYGTASSVLANGTQFWVASRYVSASSDGAYYNCAYFGLRRGGTYNNGYYMFDSNGHANKYSDRLRPVVSLPFSLLTGEQTNGAWNLKK